MGCARAGSSHHPLQDERRVSGRRHSRHRSRSRSDSRPSLNIASLDLAAAVSHHLPHSTAAQSPIRPGARRDVSRDVRRNSTQTEANMQVRLTCTPDAFCTDDRLDSGASCDSVD